MVRHAMQSRRQGERRRLSVRTVWIQALRRSDRMPGLRADACGGASHRPLILPPVPPRPVQPYAALCFLPNAYMVSFPTRASLRHAAVSTTDTDGPSAENRGAIAGYDDLPPV